MKPVTSEGRIRRAALFLLLGLGLETLSFYWRHPLSFLVFLGAWSLLALLGIASLLLSFVSPPGLKSRLPNEDSREDAAA